MQWIMKLTVAGLLLGVTGPSFAAPRPAVAAKEPAPTADDMFGAIWIDGDLEDADIEDIIRRGLRAGVSPNARAPYGDTLLLQAIENNRPSVVRMLLGRGANVNLADREGTTPLLKAVSQQGIWPDQKPFAYITRLLLAKKANPNVRDSYGRTALMLATDLEIARLLVRGGAAVDARDPWGTTALMLAAQGGRGDIVRMLLQAGANPRLRTKWGQTALLFADPPPPQSGGKGVSVLTSVVKLNQDGTPARLDEAAERRRLAALEPSMPKSYREVRRLLLQAEKSGPK